MLHEFKIPIYIARDKDQCYIRRSYTIKIMIYIKANKKSLVTVRFEPAAKVIEIKGSNRCAVLFE